ncbi:MAG TPA: hypothetical protein VF832_03065, partial [Longimicrobiales bacterium]
MRRTLPPVLLLCSLACAHSSAPLPSPAAAAAPAQAVGDAASLVQAMHDRWAGRWYHAVSFRQKTSRVLPNDSVSAETWLEWASLPGKLRIQMGDPAQGRGAIYSGDSTFVVRNGSVVRRAAGRNPLLILGFDVYTQPPERTLDLLRQEGIDLGRFHEDSWQGKPVWVVGAAAGDLKSKQFWIEKDRLLFLRLLEPAPNDSTRTNDVRFASYAPLGNGWIAPLVEVWDGGKRVFWEEYSDMRADPPLP